jgi:ribosome maturation factor RimP
MEETIANLLEEKFQEPEFADCFLVDINQSNKRLEVFVDSDSGMSFKKCQQLSRHLEAYLDEEKPLGENYVLEVSSPGVKRPLKFWRQYPRNVGRKVEVTMQNKDKHTGTLVEVTPSAITLEEKVRRKEGKRKVTEMVRTELPYDEIAKTIVKISF